MEKINNPSFWQPLIDFIGEEHCDKFMFMRHDLWNGVEVYLYKNIQTRMYLNLDKDGNCYNKNGEKIKRIQALMHCLFE